MLVNFFCTYLFNEYVLPLNDLLQPKMEEVAQIARPDSLKPVSSLLSVEVESEKVKEGPLAVDVTE